AYAPPPLRVGDHVRCVYRRRWCRVTGWTAGPLRWPVGHPLKGSGGGGHPGPPPPRPGGPPRAVWGPGRARCGWRGAVAGARGGGGGRVRSGGAGWGPPPRPRKPKPPRFGAVQAQRARELGIEPQQRWERGGWTPEQLALLGTAPDAEVAAKIGRSVAAVWWKR